MKPGTIIINSIDYRGSICDGPGIRTVVFLQGCNIHCKGCQNPQTWDIHKGKQVTINKLIDEICANSYTKRITISGGEPLMQVEAVYELIRGLHEKKMDIALYTSYEYKNIPQLGQKHCKIIFI